MTPLRFLADRSVILRQYSFRPGVRFNCVRPCSCRYFLMYFALRMASCRRRRHYRYGGPCQLPTGIVKCLVTIMAQDVPDNIGCECARHRNVRTSDMPQCLAHIGNPQQTWPCLQKAFHVCQVGVHLRCPRWRTNLPIGQVCGHGDDRHEVSIVIR